MITSPIFRLSSLSCFFVKSNRTTASVVRGCVCVGSGGGGGGGSMGGVDRRKEEESEHICLQVIWEE